MVLKPLPVDDVEVKPCYPHVVFVGLQRSCKDIVLVKDIFDLCRNKKSIFDNWFASRFLDMYEKHIKNVYANCWLDSSYLPGYTSYELVTDVEQFNSLYDGILYLHDIEMIFNSRGSISDKDMQKLLEIVNNAGKHRLQIRASCHRDMSVDVKLRSLINLWIEPTPYHSSNMLSSYTVALKIFGSDRKKIAFDGVDGLHHYAPLYNTEEESVKLKKGEFKDVGHIPLGQRPMSYNQLRKVI